MKDQSKKLRRCTPILMLLIFLGILTMFSFQKNFSSYHMEHSLYQLDTIPRSYMDTVIKWDADLDMSTVTISRVFPGVMVESTDTITVYDYDTDEEIEKVVTSEHIKKEIVLQAPYIGTHMVTDTIITFDPTTKMETIEYVRRKVFDTVKKN